MLFEALRAVNVLETVARSCVESRKGIVATAEVRARVAIAVGATDNYSPISSTRTSYKIGLGYYTVFDLNFKPVASTTIC